MSGTAQTGKIPMDTRALRLALGLLHKDTRNRTAREVERQLLTLQEHLENGDTPEEAVKAAEAV